MKHLRPVPFVLLLLIAAACTPHSSAQNAPASTQPGLTSKLQHVTVDVNNKQVRVECTALAVDSPLEFFCVRAGGPEHETVLRTLAKPSDIHLGLLMLGLKPGRPVRYSQAADRWYPPIGPPVRISVEFDKDGKHIKTTANRLMRNTKTKKPMPDLPWMFVGSQVLDDGTYAADATGYVVSVVNFDLTVIDVPDLRSSDNETLEWETDLSAMPPADAPVTMILEPVGQPASQPAAENAEGNAGGNIEDNAPGNAQGNAQGNAAGNAEASTPKSTDPANSKPADPPARLEVDDAHLKALRQRWEKAVRPRADALRDAAQAHYDVIMSLRAEQQHLIDEADQIQRLIDDLEREYQNITTPRPSE